MKKNNTPKKKLKTKVTIMPPACKKPSKLKKSVHNQMEGRFNRKGQEKATLIKVTGKPATTNTYDIYKTITDIEASKKASQQKVLKQVDKGGVKSKKRQIISSGEESVDKFLKRVVSDKKRSAKYTLIARRIRNYQVPVWIIKSNRNFYGLTPADMDVLLELPVKRQWYYLECGQIQTPQLKTMIMRSSTQATMKARLEIFIKTLKRRDKKARPRIKRFTFALNKINQYEQYAEIRSKFSQYN